MPGRGRGRSLEATLEALCEVGADALTTRDIARRSGLTQPAIYRHFSGKSELVATALHELRSDFRRRVVRAVAGAATPRERLERALETFRDYARDCPHGFDALFVAPPTSNAALRAGLGTRGDTIFQLLVDRVAECMAVGDLAEEDPAEVALLFAALARGLVLLYRRGRFASVERFEAFWAEGVGRLIRGSGVSR